MLTQASETPNGARLKVVIFIDSDKWNELKAQGYSDEAIQQSIENAITFKETVKGLVVSPPIWDIESATLEKYF